MDQVSCLPILLILIAIFILYNEYNKKADYIEMLFAVFCVIALVRTAYKYIKLENLNKNSEGFSNRNRNSKRRKSNFQNKNEKNEENDEAFENKINDKYDMIINSEDSEHYLDIEKENMNDINKPTTTNYNTNVSKSINENPINKDAVSSINDLLGIGSQREFFADVPNTTFPNINSQEEKDDIKSVFSPKIIIGGQNQNGFDNTENEGKWTNAFSGNEFDVKAPTKYTDKKSCAKYSKRDTDLDTTNENLVIKEYKDAKTWHPGYTYLPPSNWDVPQKYPPVCLNKPNVFQLTGLVDRGLPLNVLELNPQGKVASTENSVQLTNVGSMLPKFSFEEMPFSKPYV